MLENYTAMVTALKALQQTEGEGQGAQTVTLPMAEDEWYTRPDTVSYGIVSLDFEAGSRRGDNVKQDVSHGGSVHLFSLVRSGAGWVNLITATLTAYCGGAWSLNSHTYERETGLFHWEWAFETEG